MVAPQVTHMDLLTDVASILSDKNLFRMSRLNHRPWYVKDRLEDGPRAGIVERLTVGNQDSVADAIVNFSLLL